MLKVLSRAAAVATLAGAVLAASPHGANALSFEFKGAKTPDFLGVTGQRNGSGYSVAAGGFDFIDRTVGGTLGSFVAWCFDLDTSFSPGKTYTYEPAPGLLEKTPPYLAGARERVQKLFDKSFGAGVLSTAANSAGFQIAVWEVLYDDDFDLAGGKFTATGGDANARAAASGFLSGVKGYSGSQNWSLAIYDGSNTDPKAQDIGVATAIPLPAAAWLLLGVSGVLVAAKRRSARKAS